MAHFTVTLADQTTDLVQDADAYQQEGPLTTFFAFTGDRRVIDSWSIRLASYRTSDISAIRRTMAPDRAAGGTERQELDSTAPRSDREPVRCRSRSDSVLLAG